MSSLKVSDSDLIFVTLVGIDKSMSNLLVMLYQELGVGYIVFLRDNSALPESSMVFI